MTAHNYKVEQKGPALTQPGHTLSGRARSITSDLACRCGLAGVLLLALMMMSVLRAGAAPLNILAAENFYGDIAEQIGGPEVTVVSVLQNPDQDPHLFETSPRVARDLTHAKIVIYNGMGYDPWMRKLVAATHNPERKIIVVAELIGSKYGANPHIWYRPGTMLVLAKRLEALLASEDPAHAAAYQRRLAGFENSLRTITARIASLHVQFAGTPVTATEPVFGYMLKALGMEVRNQAFQLSVMNGTEPGARDIAAFENDLRQKRVKLLIYNSQATTPLARHMLEIAKSARIPVIAVTETEPPGQNYQAWMMDELEQVEKSLSEGS